MPVARGPREGDRAAYSVDETRDEDMDGGNGNLTGRLGRGRVILVGAGGGRGAAQPGRKDGEALVEIQSPGGRRLSLRDEISSALNAPAIVGRAYSTPCGLGPIGLDLCGTYALD